MFSKKLNQKITIFSDGSLVFDLHIVNKKQKKVKCLNKDLKNFQKNLKQKSLNNLSKTNRINTYRKKYF